MVRLADTLTSRFDVDRQEGDVERLVEVRRELVGREDLAERVGDPAVTWARFGRALLFQWEEDPVANAGNLGEFLTAMETCLGLSSESRPYWFAWLADGGNAHLLAYLNGLPNADLSLAIDRARAVLTSGDAEDHDRLLPALRRLAGQEHRSVAAEQPVGLR